MNRGWIDVWRREPLAALIGLGLLLLPVSNAAGQVPLYLASVVWAVRAIRGREPVNRRTLLFLGGYAIMILASFVYALNPEQGVDKLNRLLLFPLAGAVYAACAGSGEPLKRLYGLCTCFVAGVCLLGLYDFIRFPLEVRRGTPFVHVGNMTSPQFYLAGILILLGLWTHRPERLKWRFWLVLVVMVAGLLLHQKRGVWLVCALSVGIWGLWGRRWKLLVCGGLAVGIALCFPFVRERLGDLRGVVEDTHGGRVVLWTKLAPRLFDQFPEGIGFNGASHEFFRGTLPYRYHMEEGLDHLHNNILQIRLELGWHGMVFWMVWMTSMLWTAFRPLSSEFRFLRGAVSFAFLALLLNGMVEYNFGDSEIQKLYLVLFGLLDVFPNSWGGPANAADALGHGDCGNLDPV